MQDRHCSALDRAQHYLAQASEAARRASDHLMRASLCRANVQVECRALEREIEEFDSQRAGDGRPHSC